MEFGISSYTYTWAVGIPGFEYPDMLGGIGLLDKADKLGVNLVQICDNILLVNSTAPQLKEIKSYGDKKKITIEVGTRGTEPKHLFKFLDICKKLGSKTLRTIIHSKARPITVNEAVDDLKNVIGKFEEEGITIVIENHDKHKVEELIYIIKSVNSNNLKICLDTVNSFGALESPSYVIEKLSPYVGNIHLKDFTIERVAHQMGFSIVGTPAGEGMLDSKSIIELGVKTDTNIILELWTPYQGTLSGTIKKEEEWAIQSISYIKKTYSEYMG